MTVIEVELVASTGLSVEARFEHYCYLLSFRVLHELLMNDPTMHCNRQSYLPLLSPYGITQNVRFCKV